MFGCTYFFLKLTSSLFYMHTVHCTVFRSYSCFISHFPLLDEDFGHRLKLISKHGHWTRSFPMTQSSELVVGILSGTTIIPPDTSCSLVEVLVHVPSATSPTILYRVHVYVYTVYLTISTSHLQCNIRPVPKCTHPISTCT